MVGHSDASGDPVEEIDAYHVTQAAHHLADISLFEPDGEADLRLTGSDVSPQQAE
jgi:hypothetical protein